MLLHSPGRGLARLLKDPLPGGPFRTMIIRRTRSHLALLVTATALAAPGCTLEKSDDVSEYREALPEASNVRVAGPEAESGGERTQTGAGTALLADGAAPAQGT